MSAMFSWNTSRVMPTQMQFGNSSFRASASEVFEAAQIDFAAQQKPPCLNAGS
jgi:hypothetical protein